MTTVFIAGCFDDLHLGHINILRRARALGDRLIVALNDDAHLAAKGPGRPIDTLEARAGKILRTIKVEGLIEFSDGELLDIITQLKPDIIAVGDDYTEETTVGYPECKIWGGKVVILPRTPGISTTQMVEEGAKAHDELEEICDEIGRRELAERATEDTDIYPPNDDDYQEGIHRSQR